MRVWSYILGGFVVVAIIALIITTNRDDGTTVAPQSSNTTTSTTAGAYQSMLSTMSPASSIDLLLQSSDLPEAAKAPLQQAQSLYQQALQVPAAEAIPLLDQCIDSLQQAQSIVSNEAEDASNQVSQENLKRLAANIETVRLRVEDDRDLLVATGTPITASIIERAGV